MEDSPGNGQRTFLVYPWPKYRAWVSAGQLRLVDTFVTDRSFEEFCKKHGEELKACADRCGDCEMVGERIRRFRSAATAGPSRASKHALVIRACKCGRKIAGNAYFRHVRVCQSAATSDLRHAI